MCTDSVENSRLKPPIAAIRGVPASVRTCPPIVRAIVSSDRSNANAENRYVFSRILSRSRFRKK